MGWFNVLASAKQSDIPEHLWIEASLSIDPAEEGTDKRPSFTLEANSGVQPMRLSNYPHPVIIDLKGASFSKDRTPVIMEHDWDRRLGHTTSQFVDANGIHATGIVSSDSKDAKDWVADSKNGFPFEVSIGATPTKASFLPKGKTAEVNGRSFKGPLIIAQKTSIYELTVTLVGADRNTSASVAASLSILAGDSDMKYADWLKKNNLPPEEEHEAAGIKASLRAMFDKEVASNNGNGSSKAEINASQSDASSVENLQTVDLTARRKAEAAEDLRCTKIRKSVSKYSDVENIQLEDGTKFASAEELQAHAIGENMTPDQVELALLRASHPQDLGPAIHVTQDLDGDIYSEAIACSICRDGLQMKSSFDGQDGKKYGYEHQFSEKALEASDMSKIRHMSLHQLMGITIRAASGMSYEGRYNSDAFIKEAVQANRQLDINASGPFSTLTVTNIFENVANKFLMARFMLKRSMWRMIAKAVTVNDFKAHSRYRLQENMGYLKVGPSGELKHGELADSGRTNKAETYGRMIGLTRVHLRNDDMNALRQILIGLADGAAWALDAEIFDYLLTLISGGNFFKTDNGNYITDSLSISGISAAETAFENMVGLGGKPIMSMPNRLLTGTTLKTLGKQLYNDSTVRSDTVADGFEKNPHAGTYLAMSTPWLNNTKVKKPDGTSLTGQSDDHWLMLGDPEEAAILEVALLDGREQPYIEQGESSFDTLGIQTRGYHDFGVNEGDEEAGIYSLGDDSSV